MKRSGIKLLTILVWITLCQQAMASWPIGKYHYIFSPTFSIYAAQNGWDDKGKYVLNSGQKFVSQTVGLYGAYGLGRRLDVIASLPYTFQTVTNNAYKVDNAGWGDLQFGFNYNLINFNYANFITVYAGVIVPLYSNTPTKTLGLGNNGTALRLSNSGNFSSKVFYNAEVGGAYYTGYSAPKQFSYDATLGLLANRWNQFSVDVGGVYSTSIDKTFSISTSTARNYAYTKASLNYGHSFTKRFTMFFTGFYTVTGRNIGQGYGGTVSLLFKPPFK